jgi:hypothetical protein
MFRDSDVEVIAQHLASNPDIEYDENQGPHWEKRLAKFMHDVRLLCVRVRTHT